MAPAVRACVSAHHFARHAADGAQQEASKEHVDQALDDLRHFVTTKCEEVEDVKDAAKSTLSAASSRAARA